MGDLTRQQLCAALAISESTVRRLESDGLPFTPMGRSKRYDLAEVKAWLRSSRYFHPATVQPEPRLAPAPKDLPTVAALMTDAFTQYMYGPGGKPPPEDYQPWTRPAPLTASEKRKKRREEERRKVEERRALVTHHANKRRAAKIKRTAPWADMEAIKAMYRRARALTLATGMPHHVDHVIPLQGKLVSGLHVENNLQILTGSENSKKRNRYEIDA